MNALLELEQSVGLVAERVGPAVVGLGRRAPRGSGLVVGDGRVITLASNLRRDEVTVRFADGRAERGRVAGVDPDLDVALILVDTADVEPVSWAEDPQLGPGRAIIALGNPGGRGLRVTPGFVASAGRGFRGTRGRLVEGAIEHTAPLPRGSGGGPLVDLEGRLVGVNAVRLSGGLILALPAAALRERVEQLASGELPEPRRLGIAIVPPRVARKLRGVVGLPQRDGLLVRAVEGDSSAARAGIDRGDLIVTVDGKPVEGLDTLYDALDRVADETLRLVVVRGTEERELEVSFAPNAGADAGEEVAL